MGSFAGRGSSKDKYSVTDYIYHMNSTGLIAKVPLPYASHHSSSSPTLLYDDENSDQEGFGVGPEISSTLFISNLKLIAARPTFK